VRKLLASIATLMLVLTLWTGFQSSVAYAAEIGGTTLVEGIPPGHSVGDADEVLCDSDKTTPHHHNVSHSHELGVPVRVWIDVTFSSVAVPADYASVSPPPVFAHYRDLRPPIA
jgi:hypothetical protein